MRWPEKRIYPERKCSTCEINFISKYSTKVLEANPNFEKYCSNHCRSLGLRKPMVKINCAMCNKEKMIQGSEFKWRNVKYCSKKCGGIAYSVNYSGKKNPHWKGDRATNKQFRTDGQPYRKWRKAVLIRDNYMCVMCKSTNNLEVDHIKPKSAYPELVYNIENGRVLCHICHTKTPTHSRTFTKAQFESML